jgi:hypothetical protein
MSLLESLSTGLRGAAGILSPDVQKQTFQQDQQNSLLQQQQKMQLLQHIQQQVQAGAVPADKVPFLAQRLGVPAEFLGGPGADAQGRLAEVERKKAFADAIAQLGPEPTQDQLAQVAAKFGSPDKVLDVHQRSIDRRDTLAQKAQEFQASMAQRAEAHEARIQQAREAQASREQIARMQIEARRDMQTAMLEGRRQLAALAGSLRQPQIQPLVQIMGPNGPMWVERKDAIGQVPAGAGSKAEATMAGKSDVDKDVMSLKDAIDRLRAGGGITDTSKGGVSNLMAAAEASPAGQVVGGALGSKNQSARNDMLMIRPSLLRSIMQSTGMSAKQMDSNAELKLWLSTATDPQKDYQSNINALNNIAKKYGSGGFLDEDGSTPKAPSAAPAKGGWAIKEKK